MSEQTYSIRLGDPVKSYPGGRIGGRVITFGSVDRQNEIFDPSTDFWMSGNGERKPILYRHGIDPEIRRRRFGEVQLTKAADGIWANGYLNERDNDSIKLMEMAAAGELNWSTGSVAHLVDRSPVGTSFHIDSWPIAEVSLCPLAHVAEPRNIVSLKEFALDYVEDFYSLESPSQREARERIEACEARAHKIVQDLYRWRVEQILKGAE